MPTHRLTPSLRLSLAAVLTVLALLAGGCATTAPVKIDAASNPAAADGFSYAIATRDPGRMTDARYSMVIGHVHNALASRGMFEAPDPAKADVIIDVEYGEHPPQTKVTTVSQPVMVNPASTMGGYPGSSYPGSSYPGSNIDPVTGLPRSSVVMVPTQRITYTTEKYIRIRASENPKLKRRGDPPPQMVWTVEATLDDETTDFEAALPAMIDAAIEYIGQNTGGQVTVRVQVPSG
jgi:hypothetical protein